jgi:uncharacterized protein with FMN-binding domain
MEQERNPNKALVAIIVIVLLAAAAAGVVYLMNGRQESTTSETTAMPVTNNPASSDNEDSEYKDGSYSASGSYNSPGGVERIEVSLTLQGGKITNTTATTKAASSTSRQYQSEFIDNYKELVIGKPIDEVKLSRVAGSSLTSGGFNEAIEKIKQDAAA